MENVFAEEWLPHHAALRRTARRLRPSDADDLVQETFTRALAARARYRSGSNAGAWLHRILVNLAMSEHRHDARDRRLHARALVEWGEPSESVPMPGVEELRAALAQLPEHERVVLELTEVRGLRYRDAARTLGVPIGTVMSRLHRARARLKKCVGR